MERLDVMRPWLGPEEIQAVAEVIESGWVAQGPRVAAFEAAFAARMQARHAVATSSCTTALHLALVLAGVGRGDDVVTPSFTFIASANSVRYVGARPVFADVDPSSGNITAETLAEVLTERTRAVIAVDQCGQPVDLGPIRELCDPRGIVVIEDAACGAGSSYRGRPVGAGAELTAWSFHPRKIITTGEGGMLTTTRGEWADRARRLREHGMSISAAARHQQILAPAEEYPEIGFNYRMTDVQAAIGIVQLGRLDEIVRRRRELAERYAAAFAPIRGLRLVADPPNGESNVQSCWLEVLPPYPAGRDELLRRLADQGISARRGVMAVHRQPAYSRGDHGSAPLSVTERLSDGTLILPLFHQMTTDQQDRVIDAIRTVAVV